MEEAKREQLRRYLQEQFSKKRPGSMVGRGELNKLVLQVAKVCGIPATEAKEVETIYVEEATKWLGGKKVQVCG